MMHSSQNSGWQVLVANKKAIMSCILGLFFIALVADLRDGTSHSQRTVFKRDTTATDTAIWQPAAGVKWQIQLIDAVEDTTVDADIWDIDLFDNTAETITTLKNKGHKVICYFSAGTYEDWRSDVSKFDTADFGSNLDEWPGERWLNIKSTSVRSIMSARLDLAKEKGCDGVDPDNIDAYGNENGLGLTEADSIDFLTFLASESHSRGMSIGLKNGGDIIGSVIDKMQWSVNEQCAEYNEFNKPVFHIEYSDETIESSSSSASSTDDDSDASTAVSTATATATASTTKAASATSTATAETTTEDEDDSTDGAVKAIDSSATAAASTQVTATASASSVAAKTSTSSAATSTSTSSDTEDSTDDVDDDEDDDNDDDEDDEDDEDEDDAEDAEDADDADEDDEQADDETTDVKPKHLFGHGHHKLRARATLSVSLKSTACNAASADKFSTVIKNMNLDAWVEYC
ncbi:unnamed protein product [Penicillium bialowiezense]